MAEQGFNRADIQRRLGWAALTIDSVDGCDLNRIAQGRARAMGFEIAQIVGLQACALQSQLQKPLLSLAIRGGQTLAEAVVIDSTGADPAPEGAVLGLVVFATLQNDHTCPFGAHIAVSSSGKRLAMAIGREGPGPLKAQTDIGFEHQVGSPDQGQITLATVQALASQMDGHQGRRTGGVNGHGGALGPQLVGNAAGRYAQSHTRHAAAAAAIFAAVEAALGIITARESNKNANILFFEAFGQDTCVFEGLPGQFQQDPLLGIHALGLAGRYAKKGRIKGLNICQIAAFEVFFCSF